MFIRVDVLHAQVFLLNNFPQWQLSNFETVLTKSELYIVHVFLCWYCKSHFIFSIFQCRATLSQSSMTGEKSIL